MADQENSTQPGQRVSKSWTRFIPAIGRTLMGLLFCMTGLNGFLNFLPRPTAPMPDGAAAFAGALMNTGYMFPMIMGTQLLVGVLLVVNRFVPLALVVIAPIIINIIAFHVFLAPSGLAMALIVLILEIFLIWAYRAAYRALFAPRFV